MGDPNVPPVPALPKHVPSVSVVHRRASSLEPVYRGGSPVGRGGAGRGVSVDAATAGTPGRRQRGMGLSNVPEDEQDESPRSINFSRPISPSTSSPTPPLKPARNNHSGWFAAPVVNAEQRFRQATTSRPIASDEALQYDTQNTWQAVQSAADQPVSRSKSQSARGVEGARLATGSMRVKPSGSSVGYQQTPTLSGPVNPNSPDAVYDPSTRTFIRKQDAMARFRELHDVEEPVKHYVIPQAATPRPYSPPHQPVSQRSPPPARIVQASSPALPPLHAERHQTHDQTTPAHVYSKTDKIGRAHV